MRRTPIVKPITCWIEHEYDLLYIFFEHCGIFVWHKQGLSLIGKI